MFVFVNFACFFFFKLKTAYEMRISDWSSDVCSSDLPTAPGRARSPCRGHWRRESRPDGPAARRRRRAGRHSSARPARRQAGGDRKSVVYGQSVSVRVDLGCRRLIKKKNKELKIKR